MLGLSSACILHGFHDAATHPIPHKGGGVLYNVMIHVCITLCSTDCRQMRPDIVPTHVRQVIPRPIYHCWGGRRRTCAESTDASTPGVCVEQKSPLLSRSHANLSPATRSRPFSALGFWDKNAGMCAGAMPYRRDFPATTRI